MMKSDLLLYLLISLTACKSDKAIEEFSSKPKVFRVIANQKILTSSSLWIKQDSIFITTSLNSKNLNSFVYYHSYKNSNDSTYGFQMTKFHDLKTNNLAKRLSTDSLYRVETSNLRSDYVTINREVVDILRQKKLVTHENIYKYYGNKLYFTTRGNSRFFYVYDKSQDTIYQFCNPPAEYGGYLNLIDFFLFDLNGDSEPELFIIAGRQIHNDEVSLEVLKFLW